MHGNIYHYPQASTLKQNSKLNPAINLGSCQSARNHFDVRSLVERARFEARFPSANGGSWRFSNPARCIHCSHEMSGSKADTVYSLMFPTSVSPPPYGPLRLGDNMLAP